jgi:leader peptidase (prepilin peptidase)/N-methyltransferase
MSALWFLLGSSPLAFAIVAAVLGLFIGSFLNVVILRTPVILERRWRRQCLELAGDAPVTSATATVPDERFDLMVPRSHCPHCGHPIGALENIPVLSYLFLRGKCSACGQRISWRYPAIELAAAALAFVVAWQLGFTLAGLAGIVFTWTLIALTAIDYDHQLLPDDITLPLLWGGLLVNVWGVFAPLSAAVIGAVAGYASLWLVYHLFRLITGKEGMGFGDFKLLAALGAWLGWLQLPFVILAASLLGALTGLAFILLFGRDRHLPIPFGPFLCIAGWIALLWGEFILSSYWQFARMPL